MKALNYFLLPIVSFTIALIFTPLLRKLAIQINFVDKPNHRKLHQQPIPIIGGITVFLATFLSLITIFAANLFNSQIAVITAGSLVLLAIGVVDDKIDLKANYKFFMQIVISIFAYQAGIKLESFYGLFNIYVLPEALQFTITILLITGTVNAFNLTDGIDGLAASLAIIGLIAFSLLALMLHLNEIALLTITLVGALIGFLRFNLSVRNKIFMGDAGSLFLGFVLVVVGLILIKTAGNKTHLNNAIYLLRTLPVVIAVLLVPVIDSLRVYRRRIKNGGSPFKADRTHLHHLILSFNLKHYKASLVICSISILFICFSFFTLTIFSITWVVLAMVVMFAIISNITSLNKDVIEWRTKIAHLENMSDIN